MASACQWAKVSGERLDPAMRRRAPVALTARRMPHHPGGMHARKRRLSDIDYRRMVADAKAVRTGPGGQAGAAMESSAANSIPMVDTSEKSLPGPADHQLRTPLHIAS
jgi:hypothetical protein